MKKIILLLLITLCTFISCKNEDDDNQVRFKTYTLTEVQNSGISGVVFIREIGAVNAESSVNISLQGVQEGTSYSTNIYYNSLSEGGDIAIPLREIVSDAGSATIVNGFNQNENGETTSPISYDELIGFDGYIQIRLDGIDGIIVAQGNIGSNAILNKKCNFIK